ncbi:MAG: hypothetical protein WCS98_05930 [Bacillota bacterium]|jgi:hypothetical protein|nr:hypothetical protein [Bacillota bacterium]MDD3297364.1 hypothetical protein [Bacillota bacterium]MDD3851020.1 hypothetical protein [Bacillota bacterium]MDD4707131.1 hypothetical protein [Bacillota bacterium]
MRGFSPRISDPAWHNGEFLLRNSFLVLESSEVVDEFSVKDHTKSAQLLEAFKAFK